MKLVKRSMSLLLVMVLLLGLVPASAVAVSNLPFRDVSRSDWFYDDVRYVYENGIMNGTSETYFSPNAVTTRGMIVTILHRLEGEPYAQSADFADVADGQYYTRAVAWASAHNIVEGYGNGRFGPNDNITREQLAAILFRYAELCGQDTKGRALLDDYRDAERVSDYAVDAMQWACHEGIINGTDGTLSPQSFATRAQVAAVITRFTDTGSGTIFLPTRDNHGSEDREDTYTVTFYGNVEDTGVYQTQEIEYGHQAEVPGTPVYSGYIFRGWSLDATEEQWYDFTQPVTEDLDLYAHWVTLEDAPVQEISGTYEADSTVYGISKVIAEGQCVTAIVNAVDACTMLVRIYDEETGEEIDTARAEIEGNISMEPVSAVAENELPAYYEIEIRLVDNSGKDLCDPYICKEYTQGYAEFMALTPADFEEERVVYFTDSRTEDFGVLMDEVIRIETSDSVNAMTVSDDTYTFENIDNTLRNLQPDDMIAVVQDGTILANIKIDSISVDGNTATVISGGIELAEFYKLANVDLTADEDNTPQVFGIGDWGIPYKKITQPFAEGGKIYIGKHFYLEAETTGEVALEIELKVCWFIVVEKFWVQTTLKTETTFDLSLTRDKELKDFSKMKKEKEKATVASAEVPVPTPVPTLTVDVGFKIPVEVAITGRVNLTTISEEVKGFEYKDGKVHQWERSYEDTTGTVEGEGEIKFGIEGNVGVAILETAEVGFTLGAGVKGNATASYVFAKESTAPSYHACTSCIDGELKGYVEIGAYAEICEIPVLKPKLGEIEGSVKRFHCSLINDERSCYKGKLVFGWGECPNKVYRTDIVTLNADGNDMEVPVELCYEDGSAVGTDTSPLRAYLYNGTYSAEASFETGKVKQEFEVSDNAVSVEIKEKTSDEPDEPDDPDEPDEPVSPDLTSPITGTVVDAMTEEPIVGAQVLLYGASDDMLLLATKTDASGKFTLQAPALTSYRIQILGAGYGKLFYHLGNTDLGTIGMGCAFAFIIRPRETVELEDGTTVSDVYIYEAIVNGEKAIVTTDNYGAYILSQVLYRNGREIPTMVGVNSGTFLGWTGEDGTVPVWEVEHPFVSSAILITTAIDPQFSISDNTLTWNEGDSTVVMWESVPLSSDAKVWVTRRTEEGDYVEELIAADAFNAYRERNALDHLDGYCWIMDQGSTDGYDYIFFVMDPISE